MFTLLHEVQSNMLPELLLLRMPESGALPEAQAADVEVPLQAADVEVPLEALAPPWGMCSKQYDRVASAYWMKVPICTTCMLLPTNDLTSFVVSSAST